jgi:hypothetical protein
MEDQECEKLWTLSSFYSKFRVGVEGLEADECRFPEGNGTLHDFGYCT